MPLLIENKHRRLVKCWGSLIRFLNKFFAILESSGLCCVNILCFYWHRAILFSAIRSVNLPKHSSSCVVLSHCSFLKNYLQSLVSIFISQFQIFKFREQFNSFLPLLPKSTSLYITYNIWSRHSLITWRCG